MLHRPGAASRQPELQYFTENVRVSAIFASRRQLERRGSRIGRAQHNPEDRPLRGRSWYPPLTPEGPFATVLRQPFSPTLVDGRRPRFRLTTPPWVRFQPGDSEDFVRRNGGTTERFQQEREGIVNTGPGRQPREEPKKSRARKGAAESGSDPIPVAAPTH